MDNEILEALAACGITEEYAKQLATQYSSERTRILEDPVHFIQERWYENEGPLQYATTTAEMYDAFIKLQMKPELAKHDTERPRSESLFGHRDIIEWATQAIAAEYYKQTGKIIF